MAGFPEDGVGVDGGGAARVAGLAMEEVGVGDVDGLFGRGEGDAVGAAEAVGDNANVARRRVKAVDLLRELGFWAEALLVAVDRVGEPDAPVRVDDDVVGRVEGARMVVVQERGDFMRLLGFHVDQTCRFTEGSLGAEDEAVAIIGAAVGHQVADRGALRAANLVPREVGRGEDFDFGDEDCFVVGADGIRGVVGNEV